MTTAMATAATLEAMFRFISMTPVMFRILTGSEQSPCQPCDQSKSMIRMRLLGQGNPSTVRGQCSRTDRTGLTRATRAFTAPSIQASLSGRQQCPLRARRSSASSGPSQRPLVALCVAAKWSCRKLEREVAAHDGRVEPGRPGAYRIDAVDLLLPHDLEQLLVERHGRCETVTERFLDDDPRPSMLLIELTGLAQVARNFFDELRCNG